MTKDSSPAFDARYDPVYQRGFTGAATPARIHAVEPPKLDRVPRPDSAAASRTEPARQLFADRADEHDASNSFAVPSVRSAMADPAEKANHGTSTDDEPRGGGLTLRGNPWVATLWVVAVLLLTSGFLGTWRSQSIYVGASPITDMNEIVTFQVLQLLSPSLVLVGLMVLGGLLFLHAVSWRDRRAEK